ncbi:MAG: hypothetical protein NXH70_04395 [Hyphomonas sp.]|nr:hypothetical protein [Hyphomonas sp.]
MAINVSFNQPAYGTELIQRARQSERPHFADRRAELINATTSHLTAENVAKTGSGKAEAHLSVRLNFDNGDGREVGPNRTWIEVFSPRQTEPMATRFPMFQEINLRRREACEFC